MNLRTRFVEPNELKQTNPNEPRDINNEVHDHNNEEARGGIYTGRLCQPHMEDPQINFGTDQIMAHERSCPVTLGFTT